MWFFEVDLDSQERLSNAPLGDDTHWMQAVQLLHGSVTLQQGDPIDLRVCHDMHK